MVAPVDEALLEVIVTWEQDAEAAPDEGPRRRRNRPSVGIVHSSATGIVPTPGHALDREPQVDGHLPEPAGLGTRGVGRATTAS